MTYPILSHPYSLDCLANMKFTGKVSDPVEALLGW